MIEHAVSQLTVICLLGKAQLKWGSSYDRTCCLPTDSHSVCCERHSSSGEVVMIEHVVSQLTVIVSVVKGKAEVGK